MNNPDDVNIEIPRYIVPETMREEIETRFTYHAPKGNQPQRYVALREKARELAMLIIELTPNSREQALALTHLEQSSFYANAAIARRE